MKRQGECPTPTSAFVLYIQFIFQQYLIKVIWRSHTHFTVHCVIKTIIIWPAYVARSIVEARHSDSDSILA